MKNEGSINQKMRIKKIKIYIAHMPTLSTTVTKVMEICNRPDTLPNDLNRVISLDPVLTGQVLKLINSAYYSLPNKITSLTRAIIMLGLNTVKNLALSSSVLKNIRANNGNQSVFMDIFWAHSLCVGVTAKALAAINGIPINEREEYFVAGLVHDLGKIPLLSSYPEEYFQIFELAKTEQSHLKEAEKNIFNIDHCHVGKIIAKKWKLNSAVSECLEYHHSPQDSSPENYNLIKTVSLADIYANLLEKGLAEQNPFDKSIEDQILNDMGVSQDVLIDLRSTVLDQIEKSKVFLEI